MSEALKLAKSLVEIHNGHDDEGPTVFFDAAEMIKAQAAEIERLASNQEAHVRELAALNVRCERLRALTWAPPCHNGNSAERWNKLAVDRYQENCKLEAELESLRAERDALKADAERYRWLTEDHQDPAIREKVGRIGSMLWVRGKGSSDEAIDAAKEQQ